MVKATTNKIKPRFFRPQMHEEDNRQSRLDSGDRQHSLKAFAER